MSITPTTFEATLHKLSSGAGDFTLDTLLDLMGLAFEASQSPVVVLFFPQLKDYHKHLKPEEKEPAFHGVYVFGTKDGGVEECRVFKDGEMFEPTYIPEKWNIKVAFKDDQAFWKFLFSGGQDIMEAVLVNDVEVFGNLNYLYKFGYMAKDLMTRLGLPH